MKTRLTHFFRCNNLRSAARLAPFVVAAALVLACSPPVQQRTGSAAVWDNARETFAKGGRYYDKSLDILEDLTNKETQSAYSDRARVLRVAILSGEVNGYKMLADTYAKGADAAKNPANKADFLRLRTDNLLRGSKLALGIGEVAMQLTKGGTIPKNLTLEAPYPKVEAPMGIPALSRVKDGLPIGADDQEQAELDAPSMGVEDVLADILRGDRFKAKTKMNAGPLALDGSDFALFLGDEVLVGAAMYDQKHLNDPARFRLLAGVADGVIQAAEASLKDSPDPDKAKRLKKLEDQLKAARKSQSVPLGRS